MVAIKSGKNYPRLLIVFWSPVMLWMSYIFYCSSLQGKDIPPLFPHQDIVFHVLTYAILAFLFSRAMKNSFSAVLMGRIVIFALLFGLFYGASDEFHQSFVPGRTADIFDLLIDGIGSLIGGVLYRWQK